MSPLIQLEFLCKSFDGGVGGVDIESQFDNYIPEVYCIP